MNIWISQLRYPIWAGYSCFVDISINDWSQLFLIYRFIQSNLIIWKVSKIHPIKVSEQPIRRWACIRLIINYWSEPSSVIQQRVDKADNPRCRLKPVPFRKPSKVKGGYQSLKIMCQIPFILSQTLHEHFYIPA